MTTIKPTLTRAYPRVGVKPKQPPIALRPAAVSAEPELFHFFWGGPFSNWHPSRFVVDNVVYANGEQWMMAGKARLFGDVETLEKILVTPNPKAVKALGRDVRNFDEERWVANRVSIVQQGNRHKFEQNPDLLEKLLAVDGTFVEASPHDQIWGIGLRAQDPRALRRESWRGLNLLGDDVLTSLRDEFRSELTAGPKP